MKNENLEKIYLEKNKTSPLLKTSEKDFQLDRKITPTIILDFTFFKFD